MYPSSIVLNEFEDTFAVDQAPTNSTATATSAAPRYDLGELSTQGQVQNGLNLFLRLKTPVQMPALMQSLIPRMPDVQRALRELHYVHFARFVPTPDGSYLIVMTEYDGDLRSYVMDFVAVLGDVFNIMLSFMQDAPPLPVQQFPEEFWAYVRRCNIDIAPWSAYPHMTVIDILRARRGK